MSDGIDRQLSSLEYVSVDEVAPAAAGLGKGSFLAKIDIRATYRLVPVAPRDRLLLGMKWRGQLYVDAMLPFGLHSAPKLFNAVADTLEWCLRSHGVSTGATSSGFRYHGMIRWPGGILQLKSSYPLLWPLRSGGVDGRVNKFTQGVITMLWWT